MTLPATIPQGNNDRRKLAADYGLVLLLAAIFGLSFSLTKIALSGFSPIMLVTLRLLIAAIFAVIVMLAMGQKLPGVGPIWKVIIASAFFGNVLPFFLISWGQERVDAGLAAILMATMPLITILLAHFITRDEKLTPFKIAGFVLGLLGVMVLIGFDKLVHFTDQTIRSYAIGLAACCYALNAVMTKWLTGMEPSVMIAALMLASTVLVLPFVFLFGTPLVMTADYHAIMALILLALFPTAIGTYLIYLIVKRQGASFLSQINFMVPVSGVIWSVLLVHEVLPVRAFLALVIIFAGIGVSRMGPFGAKPVDKVNSNSTRRRETKQ